MKSMTLTVDISRKYNEGIVKRLDNMNFFQLSKEKTGRRDLYNFAVALGINQNYHTRPEPRESFYRTEGMGNSYYLYSSLFFRDEISSDLTKIDAILDSNKVIGLSEEYANTGFSVLEEKEKNENSESFMYDLINKTDELYTQFCEDNREN
ncbi:MAG: hypothetical protein MJZ77_05625 [Bacteroidales bacterium]|nr:hypothetical protein [Bacteroidales bacterium]